MGDFNNAAHHSEHSVLVIAATLSIADAVESRPGGPERTPERPAAVRPAKGNRLFRPESRKNRKRKTGTVTIAHRKSGLIITAPAHGASVFHGPTLGGQRIWIIRLMFPVLL